MKKKLLAVALCICTVFSMAACSKKGETSEKTGIELGQYTGYTVGESVTEVSEEEVQRYIEAILEQFSTTESVTEGTTVDGDSINVTYHETVNGEEVGETETGEDGTSTGTTTNLQLTEGGFAVAGFVEGLVGKNVGDTVEMDLQYPEDYSDADLAGQPVHYSVKINYLNKTSVPEYNDEFVNEHYSFAGYTTAEDFTNFIKQEIYYINVNNAIWEDIIDAQKVIGYPKDELQGYVDRSFSQIESMMTSYGYTMDVYYQMQSTSEEELKKELEEDCKKIVKEKMFVRAVAEKEGIKYSEEEAKKYAAISGYTSVEEFEEYLNYYGEELEYTVLSYQVQNFISEHINLIPDEKTTAEEATATGETTTAAPEDTTETETAAE